jgi:hypothetical protein
MSAKSGLTPTSNYRFSGHETFPCRYAWLPKAVQHLSRDHLLFSDEENAMVSLGVGKNMVRAIKFWAEASGVIEELKPEGLRVTNFGNDVLGREGYDPYLERIQTVADDVHLLPSACAGGGAGPADAQDTLRIQRGGNQPRVFDVRGGDGEATESGEAENP